MTADMALEIAKRVAPGQPLLQCDIATELVNAFYAGVKQEQAFTHQLLVRHK